MRAFLFFSVLSCALFAAEHPEIHKADVVPFLQKHCVSCHGPEKQKGRVRLDTLGLDFSDAGTAALWTEVMDNINLGEMPPEEKPRPDVTEVGTVAGWIASELRHMQKAGRSTGGRVLMRRLNRREYSHAVRDLLHVDFLPQDDPRELLPPDGRLDGFDTVSRALLLDPSLMEQYFHVASIVAEKAIQTGLPPVPTRTMRMQYEDLSGSVAYILDDKTTSVRDGMLLTTGMNMRSDDKLRHPWSNSLIPVPGRYRVRLRVGADPGDRGEPLVIRVRREGDKDLYFGKVTGTLENPQVIDVERPFNPAGGNEFAVTFVNPLKWERVNYFYQDYKRASEAASKAGDRRGAGRVLAQMTAEGMIGNSRPNPELFAAKHRPTLGFDWIEVTGPLYKAWPPESTTALFHRGLDPSEFGADYAREIFSRLMPRAFRRPVAPEEIQPMLELVRLEMAGGQTFPEAMKAGLIAVLCSPSFLLVDEPAGEETRMLNDYEIAMRLSLLAWSSIPDARLFELAKRGALRDPERRGAEFERMLADSKSEAFIDGFAKQWLKAEEFDRFAVDRGLYRDYYAPERAGLNESVNREPVEFFRELLRSDGSLLDFLASDWTMANDLLAEHYGISGVTGAEFQKVKLPASSHRGGLVTMAAVHKWGSDGNRTKPVERGKYILDVLFNDPPDPPPPNVGEVEPNIAGENLTVRERLDQHREIESCAACHRRIDPYGLALENFNVVGTWRTKQDGERAWWPDKALIDPGGTLPNGRSFETFDEFRTALRDQGERFLRAVSEKLMIYALGRGIEPSDRVLVEELVTAMKRQGESPRSLLQAFVRSETFVTK